MGVVALVFQERTHVAVFAINGFFAWIVVGLLAGWIAGHLTRGRGFGCIVDIILGLIGAVIGGWIFTRLGISALGFFGSLAAATVGAVLLVAIARLFAGHN
ncbi:MAG TPA: GlsB/YeaQ/YmgE family stress response membrane protein [Candidatus Acidoferrum sp.]|jgi:uncharacterized membrane protein YeaQ/YmgE (transglycosylase-associated protein family)|nr:GlsB/YeaQ/YmgE family stress response membrane protein [Candidatus Acidoferrum sp.]